MNLNKLLSIDTLGTWKNKLNATIEYLNTINIGIKDSDVPINSTVNTKIDVVQTNLNDAVTTVNNTIEETVIGLETQIENTASKSYSDSLSLVIALS